jgi:four helix bundle protein
MDYRTNKAWQRADDLAMLIYELVKRFPRDELYGLTSQVRRAAVSAAESVAEGLRRKSAQDYLRFQCVARGSLMEVEYYIHSAQRLGIYPRRNIADYGNRKVRQPVRCKV